jgi:hypothetical protein
VRRAQLEHLIRAAGAVTGSRRLVVIGSQAILGTHPNDAPAEAVRSREADLIPIDALDTVDVPTGALGELSAFDEAFGYHAADVDLTTATLRQAGASGSFQSTIRTRTDTSGSVSKHTTVVSKYVAGRGKDREFCRALVRAGFVDRAILRDRLACTGLDVARRKRIEALVDADFLHDKASS